MKHSLEISLFRGAMTEFSQATVVSVTHFKNLVTKGTNVPTDERKIYPFCRTSSPTGPLPKNESTFVPLRPPWQYRIAHIGKWAPLPYRIHLVLKRPEIWHGCSPPSGQILNLHLSADIWWKKNISAAQSSDHFSVEKWSISLKLFYIFHWLSLVKISTLLARFSLKLVFSLSTLRLSWKMQMLIKNMCNSNFNNCPDITESGESRRIAEQKAAELMINQLHKLPGSAKRRV